MFADKRHIDIRYDSQPAYMLLKRAGCKNRPFTWRMARFRVQSGCDVIGVWSSRVSGGACGRSRAASRDDAERQAAALRAKGQMSGGRHCCTNNRISPA